MPYTTVTLSSAGTSPVVNLNWRGGKPITATVIVSTVVAADFTVQYTLDDVQLSTSPTWLSFGSSANFYAGVSIGSVYPLAALRISSTTFTAGTLTFKVIQGEGW